MTPGEAAAADVARDRMSELGLTQRSLAQKAGVDPKTVNNFLKHYHFPNVRNRGRIEAVLWPQEPPGTLSRVAGGGKAPSDRATETTEDPAEAQIMALPYLLEGDKQLFLRVYRNRRDERTAARLEELEMFRDRSLKGLSDPEVRAHISSTFEEQIAEIQRRGYEQIGNDIEP